MINTIYVDVDGVLADFIAYVEANSDFASLTFPSNNKRSKWMDEFMDEHVNNSYMFANLPKMPKFNALSKIMKTLRAKGYKVAVLTSISDRPHNKKVEKQKMTWLAKNGIGSFSVFTVEHSRDKALYAKDDALLIDDREKSTKPFIAAGGSAILYDESINLKRELAKNGIEL